MINCKLCKSEFEPKNKTFRYCGDCKTNRRKELQCLYMAQHRARTGKIKNPGVGKGGANTKGTEDSDYKNGIVYFIKNRTRIKTERKNCEKCSKDLTNATRYNWVIHHIDHNRSNNIDSNFQLLCKKCHQLEHECYKNLERVTTSREA